MDTLQRKLACAAVLSAVLATSVARAAAPPYTPMVILGIGNHSCGDYLRSAAADRKARPAHSDAQDMFFDLDHGLYMAWVDGYLTAANSYDPDKRMAGQNTTHLARGQWLEKFCGDHPQSPFLAAVNALHDASGVPVTGLTAPEPTRPQPELRKMKLAIATHSGAVQVMTVTGNAVYLRAQPNTKAVVLAELGKGAKVTAVGTAGSWTRVKYKNLDGYISTRFLM